MVDYLKDKPSTVMAVCDYDVITKTFRNYLKRHNNYEVIESDSGRGCLRKLIAHYEAGKIVNCLVIYALTPRLDDLGLLASIRNSWQFGNIPIILIAKQSNRTYKIKTIIKDINIFLGHDFEKPLLARVDVMIALADYGGDIKGLDIVLQKMQAVERIIKNGVFYNN